MAKTMRFALFLPLLFALVFPVSGPIIEAKAADDATLTLKVWNWEDYIGYELDENGEAGRSIYDLFADYVYETDGVRIDVLEATFDTNEDMLSQLQTGSAAFDLICPSDYAIQKMMSMGLLQPFAQGEEERRALYGDTYEDWADDNFMEYASPYLIDWFDKIQAKVPNADGSSSLHPLNEYARGYMWGTLGITYNPNYSAYLAAGLTPEDVMVQMNDWNSLWDGAAYSGTFQIKDSMRDTYSVGLMRAFDDVFSLLLELYRNGTFSTEEYTDRVNIVFNNINHVDEFNALMVELNSIVGREEFSTSYTPEEIVDTTQRYLEELKAHSYGLETDSGKTDIQTGTRSGICLAWSGDAIYSMDTAEEETGIELYYSVPDTGGNIWFDGWVIPGNAENVEYANKFIDFISRPDIAALNMDYIGYTPFIAGDGIVEKAKEWYDEKTWAIEEDPSLLESVADWDAYAEEQGWLKVDLSYFFEGSLSEGKDAIFYTSEIVPVTGKNLDGEEETVYVGRQFLAQYPTEDMVDNLDIIPGLAVMEDYGENNDYVLRMWENVKASGVLETWIIVVFSLEIAIAAGLIAFFLIKKKLSLKRRRERRAAN